MKALREAATALADRLDLIKESGSFRSVFQVAAIHHCPYIGLTWTDEVAALRAALSAPPTSFYFTSKDWPATFDEMAACVGPGWKPLLMDLTDKLLYLGWGGGLWQVKEKYGELSFYWINDVPDPVLSNIAEDVVMHAESRSGGICEACGKYGERRGKVWIKTRCDECWAKEEQR
jgi:hypothetical protein